MKALSAVYIRNGQQVMEMLRQLEQDYANCQDKALYLGFDTETRPGEGGPAEDALRWWGPNPGAPFLYIIGWSTQLGHVPCRFYAIPEEFDWAFARVVEFANEHTPVHTGLPVEWVMFNRTFDLGMTEISAGFKIAGTHHEVFTVLRTACFIPDWWEDMSLKGISSRFLDPKADEPKENLEMWKAAYESHRNKELTKRLQKAKFSKKALTHYKEQNMPIPFHVEQVIEEWKREFPDLTSWSQYPENLLIPYAMNDVYLTLWLFFLGMRLIVERKTEEIYEREQLLYRYNIRQQTIVGWRVDRRAARRAEIIGRRRIRQLKRYLQKHLDWDGCPTISQDVREEGFNPNSSDQIKKLFAHIGLHLENLQAVTLHKWIEKDGQRTRWADVIEKYLDYKLYTKLHGTYAEPLYRKSACDGFAHASIRQDRAYTGRQSMQDPPLQTIPRKEVPEFNIRQVFMPSSSDFRLWLFDYSGMEVTMFAEYCRDPVMLGALAAGADFHSMLALKAFKEAREIIKFGMGQMGTPLFHMEQLENDHTVDHHLLEQVKEYLETNHPKVYKKYKNYRQAAKTGMFAILYGAGADKLSIQMTELSGIYISPQVAADFKKTFYELYKKAWEFTLWVSENVTVRHALHPVTNHGRTYGWIRNMYGRLYLMEPRDSYKGVNYLVQGSCADLLKQKIIKIAMMLENEGYKSRLILSIHDELVFELHKEEEKILVPKIKEIMEDNPELQYAHLKAEASWCKTVWATKKTFTGDWSVIAA